SSHRRSLSADSMSNGTKESRSTYSPLSIFSLTCKDTCNPRGAMSQTGPPKVLTSPVPEGGAPERSAEPCASPAAPTSPQVLIGQSLNAAIAPILLDPPPLALNPPLTPVKLKCTATHGSGEGVSLSQAPIPVLLVVKVLQSACLLFRQGSGGSHSREFWSIQYVERNPASLPGALWPPPARYHPLASPTCRGPVVLLLGFPSQGDPGLPGLSGACDVCVLGRAEVMYAPPEFQRAAPHLFLRAPPEHKGGDCRTSPHLTSGAILGNAILLPRLIPATSTSAAPVAIPPPCDACNLPPGASQTWPRTFWRYSDPGPPHRTRG
ncbi:Hypothetical predicted protein, partial [Pelobates cultripes]